MPTHGRLGTDDCEDLQDRWKPTIEADKEQAIVVGGAERGRASYAAERSTDVGAPRWVGFRPALRLEWRDQDGQYET
jgi:hypothetical protein